MYFARVGLASRCDIGVEGNGAELGGMPLRGGGSVVRFASCPAIHTLKEEDECLGSLDGARSLSALSRMTSRLEDVSRGWGAAGGA